MVGKKDGENGGKGWSTPGRASSFRAWGDWAGGPGPRGTTSSPRRGGAGFSYLPPPLPRTTQTDSPACGSPSVTRPSRPSLRSSSPGKASAPVGWMAEGRMRSAPCDAHLICAETLVDGRLRKGHPDASAVHLQSRPCDHRAVVDAQVPRRHEHPGAAIGGHPGDHLLKAPVSRDAASQEDLLVVQMGHGPFRDFRQHRESDLLDREREVLDRRTLLAQC